MNRAPKGLDDLEGERARQNSDSFEKSMEARTQLCVGGGQWGTSLPKGKPSSLGPVVRARALPHSGKW